MSKKWEVARKGYSPIRAITFDLDDTLWDVWSVIETAEEKLHRWLEQHYPNITDQHSTLDLRQVSAEIAALEPGAVHDRSYLRKAALKLAASRSGYDSFDHDSAFDVFFHARNQVVFYDDVMPVLQRLANRYALGALSNGNADLKIIGIDHLFECSFNSAGTGRSKPHPAMFEAALAHLNLKPDQVLHVGDEPDHDVAGAANLGMRTAWINRTEREWPGEPSPDAECTNLIELEQWLNRSM